MIEKLRIGLDVDGVLYNWEAQARNLLKREFSVDLPISSEWDSIKDSVTEYQWYWLWNDALYELFTDGEPCSGIKDGVRELSELGDIVIITNTPKRISDARLQWLLDHEIHIDEYHLVDSNSDKSKITPLCDVYIDDSHHVALDLFNNTDKYILLWDRPWNESFYISSDKFFRVASWEHAINLCKLLKYGN